MGSSVGSRRLTNQTLNTYAFTNVQISVLVGILLSDAWIILSKGSKNPRLGFKQSLDKSSCVWSVFMVLFPFCKSLPNVGTSKINSKTHYNLSFYTRSLPCLNEFYG